MWANSLNVRFGAPFTEKPAEVVRVYLFVLFALADDISLSFAFGAPVVPPVKKIAAVVSFSTSANALSVSPIEVLDHVVLGGGGNYISMRDAGLF